MKANILTKETILNLGTQDRGFPKFRVGDTISVAQKIKEGNKERIQMFKGDVIAMHSNGIGTTFTVRRIGAGKIGVEKIFPYYSLFIDSIKLEKNGDVRRAKLFYIRDRIGKAARIKEKILTKEQKEASAARSKSKSALVKQEAPSQENEKSEKE